VSELRRSLDFLREAEDRETREQVPFAFGTARLDRELPDVYDLNLLRIEQGEPTAEELIAEAERIQGEAGLKHRRVQLPSEQDARLGEVFRRLGWEAEALVVMAQHREPERPVDLGAAEEVGRDALVEPWTAGMRSHGLAEHVVAQLVEHKALIAAGIPTRYFAARADGAVASYCELYSIGGIAQVESVLTLPEYRGKGLASAVVLAAAAAARGAAAELVFLVADAEDWPQRLYERLGFDELGRGYSRYLRRLDAAVTGAGAAT
jgi:ribosomal protein S18 acetylase RimI-like enzyme